MKSRSLALALGIALWGMPLMDLAGPALGDNANTLFLMAADLVPRTGLL